ncbi:MAG TPA: tetratricopeptide repeat protein [Kiritimatiellia bacterium]|nr:tetratricopeptide repeat protein [Kiritimatiellia bacterium]
MIMPRDDSKKKQADPLMVMRSLERLMGGAAKGKKEKAKAQDLVYDAWEMVEPEDALELYLEALELDPSNVDAWLGLLPFRDGDPEEDLAYLRQVVQIGEKALGEKVFKQDKGHFWGLLETRPYMRARAMLAQRLTELGRLDEAIAENEVTLELNPNDNQGLRYVLLGGYLAKRRLEDARRLFDRYDECGFSTIFAWGKILERFLSGDETGAASALAVARNQNPYAEAYFRGHRKPPKQKPGSYSIGSREEAIIAFDILGAAWEAYPEARAWLEAIRTKDRHD